MSMWNINALQDSYNKYIGCRDKVLEMACSVPSQLVHETLLNATVLFLSSYLDRSIEAHATNQGDETVGQL